VPDVQDITMDIAENFSHLNEPSDTNIQTSVPEHTRVNMPDNTNGVDFEELVKIEEEYSNETCSETDEARENDDTFVIFENESSPMQRGTEEDDTSVIFENESSPMQRGTEVNEYVNNTNEEVELALVYANDTGANFFQHDANIDDHSNIHDTNGYGNQGKEENRLDNEHGELLNNTAKSLNSRGRNMSGSIFEETTEHTVPCIAIDSRDAESELNRKVSIKSESYQSNRKQSMKSGSVNDVIDRKQSLKNGGGILSHGKMTLTSTELDSKSNQSLKSVELQHVTNLKASVKFADCLTNGAMESGNNENGDDFDNDDSEEGSIEEDDDMEKVTLRRGNRVLSVADVLNSPKEDYNYIDYLEPQPTQRSRRKIEIGSEKMISETVCIYDEGFPYFAFFSSTNCFKDERDDTCYMYIHAEAKPINIKMT